MNKEPRNADSDAQLGMLQTRWTNCARSGKRKPLRKET